MQVEAGQKHSSRGYWVMDLGQECYTGRHAALAFGLGVPGLALLAVGWPVFVSWLAWRVVRHRHMKT